MANRLTELEGKLRRHRGQAAALAYGSSSPRKGRRHGSSARRPVSRAFYGTGEHVLAGEELPDLEGHEKGIQSYLASEGYPVGQPNSAGQRVRFSYGELIAMGDLFETYDDMQAASHAELSRLRQLVRKSREHYRRRVFGQGTRGHPNTSDKDWNQATDRRYLELAMLNFSHFAPSAAAIVGAARGPRLGNHRERWEQLHRRALDTVRNSPTDASLEQALVVNGFGDHFLTDAFAAGHLFNKQDAASRFNSKFRDASDPTKLSPAGKAFLDRVAAKAWRGDLKKEFSKHETRDKYVLTIGGYQFRWAGFHPNFDSLDMFKRFLHAIHAAEPDLIANGLVALIIHDELNRRGIDVENEFGDRWKLTGDSHLDPKNLGYMRKAVARSVYNVVHEATAVNSFDGLYDKVWAYAPTPTRRSVEVIRSLVDTYTDPGNAKLVQAAADELGKRYEMLLEEARERGQVKRA